MSIASVKKVIQQAGPSINKTEAQAIVAEAQKSRVTAGEKKLVADLFAKGDTTVAARKVLADFLGERPADVQLGRITPPGPAMADKTFTLKPGQSLVFETGGNQITSASFDFSPLPSKTELIERSSALGGEYVRRYTVTIPTNVKPGTVFDFSSIPAFQSRNDPNYAFDFKLKVG